MPTEMFDKTKLTDWLKKFGAIILAAILAIAILFITLFSLLTKVADSQNISTDTTTSDTATFKTVYLPNGQPIVAELATTPEAQQTGLMHRTRIPENVGMLFIFDQPSILNFWMKDTPVSLDIIFLDAQKRVVTIYQNTTPNNTEIHYQTDLPAQYVLEVPAGTTQKNFVQIGQSLSW